MDCNGCSNKFNKADFSPRMLKCGHSICHSCILMYMNDEIDVVCGICNETFSSHGTLDDFPLNLLALVLMIEHESEPSISITNKCQFHDREVTKVCRHCKEPTCDLCSKDQHSSKHGCDGCSLEKSQNSISGDVKAHLTLLVKGYKEKKRILQVKIMEITNRDEDAFDQSLTCIRKDRLFLERCLKDAESTLEQLGSLMEMKEFTSMAQYFKYQKELEQFTKFDAKIENICKLRCHPSCSAILKNSKIMIRAIKEKLTRNEEAYFCFEGDGFRRIINEDGAFRINLGDAETVLSPSELPITSLQFKAEFWPCYTFLMKFAKSEEVRLDVDLKWTESEQIQELFKWMKDGKSSREFGVINLMNVLSFGPICEDHYFCELTSSNSNITEEYLFNEDITGLGINASELYLLPNVEIGKEAIKKEECTRVDESKLAILAHYNSECCKYEFYFMKCRIGFIGKNITLIGYHEMSNKDIEFEENHEWATYLEIF